MTKLADSDDTPFKLARKASKFGVACLLGATFLLSGVATEQAEAKRLGRGVAIGLGVFGLGVIMNEAARAERDGDYDDYDHDDDDDYRERSHRSESKSRSTRSRSSAPTIQFSQDVLETQKSLNQAGYDAGTEDGLRGLKTTGAVKAFQRDNGYPETGKLTAAQRSSLHAMAAEAGKTEVSATDDATPAETASEPVPTTASPEQESYKPNFGKQSALGETKTVAGHENTRETVPEAEIDLHMLEVEKALFSLQMIESEPDGKSDDATVAAIKQFQSFLNETPTGELTAAQRANLISLAEAY
jgi:peptidoglycan hydrolase-like protein with peptidoglycan-binding domain